MEALTYKNHPLAAEPLPCLLRCAREDSWQKILKEVGFKESAGWISATLPSLAMLLGQRREGDQILWEVPFVDGGWCQLWPPTGGFNGSGGFHTVCLVQLVGFSKTALSHFADSLSQQWRPNTKANHFYELAVAQRLLNPASCNMLPFWDPWGIFASSTELLSSLTTLMAGFGANCAQLCTDRLCAR